MWHGMIYAINANIVKSSVEADSNNFLDAIIHTISIPVSSVSIISLQSYYRAHSFFLEVKHSCDKDMYIFM